MATFGQKPDVGEVPNQTKREQGGQWDVNQPLEKSMLTYIKSAHCSRHAIVWIGILKLKCVRDGLLCRKDTDCTWLDVKMKVKTEIWFLLSFGPICPDH